MKLHPSRMTVENRTMKMLVLRVLALAFTMAVLVNVLWPGTAHAQPVPQCQDGIDNDGDTLIDYPADPGCTAPDDNSEIDVPDMSVALDAMVAMDMATGVVYIDGGATGSTNGGDPGASQQDPPRDTGCAFGGATRLDGFFAMMALLGVVVLLVGKRRSA